MSYPTLSYLFYYLNSFALFLIVRVSFCVRVSFSPTLPIIFSICCFVFFTIPLLFFTLFYQRARITKYLISTEMKAQNVKLLFKRYECLWLSDATADFKNFLLSAVTVTSMPLPSADVNCVAAPVRYKIDGTLCPEIFSHIDLFISVTLSISLSLSSSSSHLPFCFSLSLSLCFSLSVFLSLSLFLSFSLSVSLSLTLSLSLSLSLTHTHTHTLSTGFTD